MEPIFFSVVINNYNYAHFLTAAIQSVLQQTYKNYELIIVDDASTDRSREIILSYGEKIKSIFLPENAGQGATFNAAIPHCQGNVVCLLDADDIFLPDKLAVLAHYCQQHPNAFLYHHRSQYSDRTGNPINKIFPQKLWQGHLQDKILQAAECVTAPTSSLAFRKTFLATIFPLPVYLTRILADYPLLTLAGLMGEVVAIPQVLSYYRLHGHNWFCHTDYLSQDPVALNDTLNRLERCFYTINLINQRLQNPLLDIHRNRVYQYLRYVLGRGSFKQILKQALSNKAFEGIYARCFYLWNNWRLRRRLQKQSITR